MVIGIFLSLYVGMVLIDFLLIGFIFWLGCRRAKATPLWLAGTIICSGMCFAGFFWDLLFSPGVIDRSLKAVIMVPLVCLVPFIALLLHGKSKNTARSFELNLLRASSLLAALTMILFIGLLTTSGS